ncbi:phosphoribosylglycinamide formyltransferase [Bartonella tamiae Th307]|uniref:Phosphoribosylglycinamide formyltransferase n=2 Tax=Bartonella tamiae TaxID=373638 RepID=J0QS55_9HYPH|nr:phosphoribosylglycinamide formyltransferase [Bartonella tamiae Th239]EJF95054.1 phosphoribosylglycinamide formyltransferase [Bartonella tamiae Th307]
MESLIKESRADGFPAEIVAVISDNSNAKGNEKAINLNVPLHIIEREKFSNKESFEVSILEMLSQYEPDILCLAGFMRLISKRIIMPFDGRILNIHPSLLPLFKGLDTHQKALDAGVKLSGCTVHLVTEGMDEGRILAQAAVPVLKDDTPQSLAQRVLHAEHILYPAALKAFIEEKQTEQPYAMEHNIIMSLS